MPVLAGKITNGDVQRAGFLESMGVFKVSGSAIPILEVEGTISCLMDEVSGSNRSPNSQEVVIACFRYFVEHKRDVQATLALVERPKNIYHPRYNFRILQKVMHGTSTDPMYKFMYDKVFAAHGVLKMKPMQFAQFDPVNEYKATLSPPEVEVTQEERMGTFIEEVSSLMRQASNAATQKKLKDYLGAHTSGTTDFGGILLNLLGERLEVKKLGR